MLIQSLSWFAQKTEQKDYTKCTPHLLLLQTAPQETGSVPMCKNKRTTHPRRRTHLAPLKNTMQTKHACKQTDLQSHIVAEHSGNNETNFEDLNMGDDPEPLTSNICTTCFIPNNTAFKENTLNRHTACPPPNPLYSFPKRASNSLNCVFGTSLNLQIPSFM